MRTGSFGEITAPRASFPTWVVFAALGPRHRRNVLDVSITLRTLSPMDCVRIATREPTGRAPDQSPRHLRSEHNLIVGHCDDRVGRVLLRDLLCDVNWQPGYLASWLAGWLAGWLTASVLFAVGFKP